MLTRDGNRAWRLAAIQQVCTRSTLHPMLRKPNLSLLTAVFLAVSAALSVAVLAARNLYDDEISALDLLPHSIPGILRATVQAGIHPPGTDSFSFDPDAGRKRALARVPGLGSDLASAAALPDYRFVVTSGPHRPRRDRTQARPPARLQQRR
jgi:hypothetical protein